MSELERPFSPDDIMWKPGHTTKDRTKCQAMAYGDLRAYMERLDEVCGTGWSVTYQPWGLERIIAHLTIDGVTRSSVGEMTSQDVSNGIGGTVAEAQAFKRAAAMFGLGRYLYNLPAVWVPYDESKRRITDEGQKQLQQRYEAYYQKWLAKHGAKPQPEQPSQPQAPVSQPGSQPEPATNGNGHAPETQPDNPFDGPDYATLIEQLTGNCRKLADFCRTQHAQSNGPATTAQYRFLKGVLHEITGDKSSDKPLMHLLFGRECNSDNTPGYDITHKLLDWLPAEKTVRDQENNPTKGPDGKNLKVPNDNHKPEYAQCIVSIWGTIQEAQGQLKRIQMWNSWMKNRRKIRSTMELESA